MKNTTEIEDRIRYLLAKELERRVQKASERLPHRCIYNQRQPADYRKTIEDDVNPFYNRITMGMGPDGPVPVHQTIGLCMYGASVTADPPLTICEDPIDAQSCPLFEPLKTKPIIWQEFSEQIANPEWVRTHLPEVYSLLWVLDSEHTLRVPWWVRLIYKILRIRPEPLRARADLSKLLPSA